LATKVLTYESISSFYVLNPWQASSNFLIDPYLTS